MDRRHFTSLHSTHKPLFWYIGVCCGVAVVFGSKGGGRGGGGGCQRVEQPLVERHIVTPEGGRGRIGGGSVAQGTGMMRCCCYCYCCRRHRCSRSLLLLQMLLVVMLLVGQRRRRRRR